MGDYIKCYAYFQPKLAIFTTIEILLPQMCLSQPTLRVNFPVGGNRNARRKPSTFGGVHVLINSFHMSGALGSSNMEKVLSENRSRSYRSR